MLVACLVALGGGGIAMWAVEHLLVADCRTAAPIGAHVVATLLYTVATSTWWCCTWHLCSHMPRWQYHVPKPSSKLPIVHVWLARHACADSLARDSLAFALMGVPIGHEEARCLGRIVVVLH